MENSIPKDQTAFSLDIDPEELEHILERIDENLGFSQVLPKPALEGDDEIIAIPDLSLSNSLVILADQLKMSPAPLHLSMGVGGLRGLLLRVINLPVRLFRTIDIDFNRKLRSFIDQQMVFNHKVGSQSSFVKLAVTAIQRDMFGLADLEARVGQLEEEINEYQAEIESLRTYLAQASQRIDELERQRNAPPPPVEG